MYWIINDNIEFWPEHRKLISVHNADLNVVLTTPASRCLSLLLEAFPDVVAQQDFFTRVWEEEGMRVPTKEGANKRGNSSRLTQSFHFFMFEPIFSPVNALNQPI